MKIIIGLKTLLSVGLVLTSASLQAQPLEEQLKTIEQTQYRSWSCLQEKVVYTLAGAAPGFIASFLLAKNQANQETGSLQPVTLGMGAIGTAIGYAWGAYTTPACFFDELSALKTIWKTFQVDYIAITNASSLATCLDNAGFTGDSSGQLRGHFLWPIIYQDIGQQAYQNKNLLPLLVEILKRAPFLANTVAAKAPLPLETGHTLQYKLSAADIALIHGDEAALYAFAAYRSAITPTIMQLYKQSTLNLCLSKPQPADFEQCLDAVGLLREDQQPPVPMVIWALLCQQTGAFVIQNKLYFPHLIAVLSRSPTCLSQMFPLLTTDGSSTGQQFNALDLALLYKAADAAVAIHTLGGQLSPFMLEALKHIPSAQFAEYQAFLDTIKTEKPATVPEPDIEHSH